MNPHISDSKKELDELCDTVRRLALQGNHQQCEKLISDAMGKYPHAPHPHNLIGVILEKEGDRVTAMKHFRAARALDPTYTPSRHNLDIYASFHVSDEYAFDESDLP